MQDVPVFVKRKGLEYRDYLDAREVAIIDEEHCVRINYEAYFFGDLWNRERFIADPVTYCGMLTDPITRERFRPEKDSPRTSHEGVVYYFESDESRARFREAPDIYRLPGWAM